MHLLLQGERVSDSTTPAAESVGWLATKGTRNVWLASAPLQR